MVTNDELRVNKYKELIGSLIFLIIFIAIIYFILLAVGETTMNFYDSNYNSSWKYLLYPLIGFVDMIFAILISFATYKSIAR